MQKKDPVVTVDQEPVDTATDPKEQVDQGGQEATRNIGKDTATQNAKKDTKQTDAVPNSDVGPTS